MKVLTVSQMKKFDEYAIKKLKMPGIVLMENAGIGVKDAVIDLLGGKKKKQVLVICGLGNNGGDGFVVARHLRSFGALVTTFLLGKAKDLKGDASINCRTYKNYGGEEVIISGGEIQLVITGKKCIDIDGIKFVLPQKKWASITESSYIKIQNCEFIKNTKIR